MKTRARDRSLNPTRRGKHLRTAAQVSMGIIAWLVRVSLAHASNPYDECQQILAGGILNTTATGSQSNTQTSSYAKSVEFFSDSSKAFQTYKKDFSEAQRNGTKIDAEFHYGVIGGTFGLALSSEREMKENEFKQAFNEAKSERSSSKEASEQAAKNFSQTVLLQTRDQSSVQAWRDCISKTKETNIYAFATRDAADRTYISVIWVPGALAGSIPSIPVKFVTDGEGQAIKVDAKETEYVAAGTGSSFSVTCKSQACDNGFRVTVNANIRNTRGELTTSFTNSVDVPGKVRPEDCSRKPGYPMGRWAIVVQNATPGAYSNFVSFSGPTTGSWLPSSGMGKLEASVAPTPGQAVVMKLSTDRGNYISTNHLVVSPDGCRMGGTFLDSQGHRGEANYAWQGGMPSARH